MSLETAGRCPAGRRILRGIGIAVLVLLIALALFVGLAFPWGTIDGMRVERAIVDLGGRSAAQGGSGETPRRLIVSFSLAKEADALRRDERADYLNAKLSACEDGDVSQVTSISQIGELFGQGQVERLGPAVTNGVRRYRYRVTFADWLPIPRGPQSDFVSAIDVGGGPCFSLDGGAMLMGKLWSQSVPLRPLLR